jgi:glycerate dehydrogenase
MGDKWGLRGRIVIADGYSIDPDEAELAGFRKLGETDYYGFTDAGELPGRIREAAAVFVDPSRMTRDVIEGAPLLRYIGIMATGMDGVDLECAAERGIAVRNVPAYAGEVVAQHGFALLLSLTNHVGMHGSFAQERWAAGERQDFWSMPHMELAGKTLGIVGYGSIGRCMARIAQGFGMRVLVCTGHPSADEETETLSFAALPELLHRSDVVSLHRPLRADTERMIDAAAIAGMKDGAILLNTARGGLVDEEALAEALQSGKLRAAGLDVLADEPPLPDCPLLSLENCLVTPHIAWAGEEARRTVLTRTLQNFEDWLAEAAGQGR